MPPGPVENQPSSPDHPGPKGLQNFYADLHVHLGRSPWGGPVKITAANNMTVAAVLSESRFRKGIHLLGLVDAQTRGGLAAVEQLLAQQVLTQLPGGGFAHQADHNEAERPSAPLTLLPGAEIETVEKVPGGGGPAHFLIFVPSLDELKALHEWYAAHVTNPDLSSQRARSTAAELQQLAADLNGLFIPAHVFTPFKSLYGRCAYSWRQILPAPPQAIELGLSSDTDLAAPLPELADIPFLSSSDAHSLGRIAREYTEFVLAAPTFAEIKLALAEDAGRKIKANYGLAPRLGKYYRSHCRRCRLTASQPPPVTACPQCGTTGRHLVPGVLDRLQQLRGKQAKQQDNKNNNLPVNTKRPPYIHQVPLEFIPGVGPRTLDKLLAAFGTEMEILHRTKEKDLAAVVNPQLAQTIVAARSGNLTLQAGGGGRYGRLQPKAGR